MHYKGRLDSGPEEIYDLFAIFIQRTYTDDVRVPSDPGPEHVPDDPPFGALQFTSDEVESVLQDLDVNKGAPMAYHHILKNYASAFAKPLSLLCNIWKVSYVTPIWPYYLQFRNVLKCWFIEECTTT
jgi:hypothetical protein